MIKNDNEASMFVSYILLENVKVNKTFGQTSYNASLILISEGY